MPKVNDIRTFLKGWKETDALALVASATDDVSQSELMMVENEIKNQHKSESIITKVSKKQSKERLTNMHYFMEPKQQLSDSTRFIQSALSLELPSTTGNLK